MASNFYQTPEFHQKICEVNRTDWLYDSMEEEALPSVVEHALRLMQNTKTVPDIKPDKKLESASTSYREQGNMEYRDGAYTRALSCYNQALLYAPANSLVMKYAYSNRSALLFKIKAYSSCINDIATCFKMGCPHDIQEKLEQRKQECLKYIYGELMPSPDDFFQFKVKRNPDIPCASLAVDYTMESGLPKIIAAKDIDVGTVVAIETPFVNVLNTEHEFLSCYYCNTMSLNLHPCTKCCQAMFCSENCRSKCIAEFHNIECQIMRVILFICCNPKCRLVIKTVLKIRSLCKTWAEFNKASDNIGMERIKNSSIREIYDSYNKFSPLNFVEHRNVHFGAMWNYGFICATVIHYLLEVPSFFPKGPDDLWQATYSVAKMMMHMMLFANNNVDAWNVMEVKMNGQIHHAEPNHTWMSFAGKLKHQCEANLLPTGLNSKVALVALKPIKKGEELTISYVDHAYEHICASMSTKQRALRLYHLHLKCQCHVCTGTPCSHSLTDEQTRCYRRWHLDSKDSKTAFKATCNALTVLQGTSHTKEFQNVFIEFRKLLSTYQYKATGNVTPCE